MGYKGVLTKNYFIDPETVLEFGAEIESVMTETDRAMAEASEIIAEIVSLTERVPSQIRSRELQEQCETAQAEIRSFDFLSYGKRVNQGCRIWSTGMSISRITLLGRRRQIPKEYANSARRAGGLRN